MDIENFSVNTFSPNYRKITRSLFKLSCQSQPCLNSRSFSYEQFFKNASFVQYLFTSQDGKKFLMNILVKRKESLWSELLHSPVFFAGLLYQGPLLFKALKLFLRTNNLSFFKKVFEKKEIKESFVRYISEISFESYHIFLKYIYQKTERNLVLEELFNFPGIISLFPAVKIIHYSSCGLATINYPSALRLLNYLSLNDLKVEECMLLLEDIKRSQLLKISVKKYSKIQSQLDKILLLTFLKSPDFFEDLYFLFQEIYPQKKEEFFEKLMQEFVENGSYELEESWPIFSKKFHYAFHYEYYHSPALYEKFAIDLFFSILEKFSDLVMETNIIKKPFNFFLINLNDEVLEKVIELIIKKKYLNEFLSLIDIAHHGQDFSFKKVFFQAILNSQLSFNDLLLCNHNTLSLIVYLLDPQSVRISRKGDVKKSKPFNILFQEHKKEIAVLNKALNLLLFKDVALVGVENIFLEKKFLLADNSMTLCLFYSFTLNLLGRELLSEKDLSFLMKEDGIFSEVQYNQYLKDIIHDLKAFLKKPLLEDGVFYILKDFSTTVKKFYDQSEKNPFQQKCYKEFCSFMFSITSQLHWSKLELTQYCRENFNTPDEKRILYPLSSLHHQVDSGLLFFSQGKERSTEEKSLCQRFG